MAYYLYYDWSASWATASSYDRGIERYTLINSRNSNIKEFLPFSNNLINYYFVEITDEEYLILKLKYELITLHPFLIKIHPNNKINGAYYPHEIVIKVLDNLRLQ